MGNVHESLLKSLNQRKLLILWCARFLQNYWQNRVGGTQIASHHDASPLHIPTRTFESQYIWCIVIGRMDAIIIFMPVVLGVCSTDSCCSTIRTVIQIEWPTSCASTTISMSILHTLYKKENQIGITSTHSMFHLTWQQAPFHSGSYSCCWEEEFRQEQEKSSGFKGCNMQSVGGL